MKASDSDPNVKVFIILVVKYKTKYSQTQLISHHFMSHSTLDHEILYPRPAWWRGTVVEHRSLAGELSLSCAQPASDE